jgi:hypothetical protein
MEEIKSQEFFGINYLLDASSKVLATYTKMSEHAKRGTDNGTPIAGYNKVDIDSKLHEIKEATAKIDTEIIPIINNIKSNLASLKDVYEEKLKKIESSHQSNGGKKTKKHKRAKANKSKRR